MKTIIVIGEISWSYNYIMTVGNEVSDQWLTPVAHDISYRYSEGVLEKVPHGINRNINE